MNTCFVIQPFDGGVYDRRFDETYGPAIREVGLAPYRVDRDPSVVIPISQIEDGIRNAAACLADISEDNPNVWFEFGYAVAARKEIVLVCDKARREKFPFDVQHRKIIRYQTGSRSDFDRLKDEIAKSLRAASDRSQNLMTLADAYPIKAKQGLAEYEIAFLAILASTADGIDQSVPHSEIKNNMEKIGFTSLATQISAKKLCQKGFVRSAIIEDSWDNKYAVYYIEELGWEWVLQNEKQLALTQKPALSKLSRYEADDDIPF